MCETTVNKFKRSITVIRKKTPKQTNKVMKLVKTVVDFQNKQYIAN